MADQDDSALHHLLERDFQVIKFHQAELRQGAEADRLSDELVHNASASGRPPEVVRPAGSLSVFLTFRGLRRGEPAFSPPAR